jgi:organic hydroperoxide reductase OsmC/OhrA
MRVPRERAKLVAMAIRHREVHFPVEIGWDGGRRTSARVAGKRRLQIAPPPEFRGTDPDIWSPEDAFVTAAASCLAVTITGRVQREQLPMHDLSVRADGIVGHRADGRFGFVRIEQTVEIVVDAGHEDSARELVAKAEESCLVTASLDLPVTTTVRVHPPARVVAAA